ncbi:hypothetical protein [Capnocytophaga bilenii]
MQSFLKKLKLTDFPSVRAARASHTRLRQLADFPSVRAARAYPSLILRSRFALKMTVG